MNSVAVSVARLLLKRTVARACPSTIPRSGEEGERVNCFISKLNIGEELPMVILEVEGEELRGLGWGGEKYSEDRSASLRDVSLADFEVTHFYGLTEIRYGGLLSLLIFRSTAWPYIKVHIARLLDRVDQFFFNKKKLVTKKRMELLRFLIQRHLDGKAEFGSIGIMIDLYSMRWVEHPDADAAERQLEFYLDSMVETGELTKSTHQYQITGKALKTIEEYEEQERRHTENVKMQRLMFWLTVMIAVVTAVQAGLIRLPPLLDIGD